MFDKHKQTLSFINQKVKYEISKNGIVVIIPKRNVNIKVIDNSLEGDILDLSNLNFENMIVE